MEGPISCKGDQPQNIYDIKIPWKVRFRVRGDQAQNIDDIKITWKVYFRVRGDQAQNIDDSVEGPFSRKGGPSSKY